MQKNASLIAWEPNSASDVCRLCGWKWGLIRHRRHHCRKCGKLVCGRCSRGRSKFLDYPDKAVRVCDKCFLEITAPPTASPTQTSRKKVPELAVTNKVMFASTKAPPVQPAALTEALTFKAEKAEDSGDDDANEQDSGDETPGAGHTLQLEEVGLHHTSSHDLHGPSTVDSAATHTSQVTTETDLDDQFDLNVQEGVSSTKQAGLDAKKIKLTLSRFGNMNFTDDESSGPNSTNNANSTQDAQGFDFSPTSPLVPAEKTEDSAPVSEKAEDTGAEEAQRKSDGSTQSVREASESSAADNNNQSATAVDASASDASASAEKPAPKHRLVVRKASVVVAAADRTDADAAGAGPAPKLASHLTPMPSGGTVRRLSTLSAPTRTPFNSTTTPSPAAAAAVAGGNVGEAPPAAAAIVESSSATTAAEVNAALAEEGASDNNGATQPQVDSGASTPVLTVRPSLAAGLPEPSEPGECASVDVSEKASAEAEVPVQDLLAGAVTQLESQLATEFQKGAHASQTANGVEEGVAEDTVSAEVNTEGNVDEVEGVTKDRTESTATADSAQNDNGANNSKGNKKGGKKNRGRK